MSVRPRVVITRKKRKSGIPTGNAGEYFVMGELLRRGVTLNSLIRNTGGYDVLIGQPDNGEPLPVLVERQVEAA